MIGDLLVNAAATQEQLREHFDDLRLQESLRGWIIPIKVTGTIGIVFAIIMNIPGVGCVSCAVYPIYALAVVVVHVLCIVKGMKGERFLIPGLSPFADRF